MSQSLPAARSDRQPANPAAMALAGEAAVLCEDVSREAREIARQGWAFIERAEGDESPLMRAATVAQALRDALARPADQRVNRVLVGLLIDAFPNNRAQQPGTYAEALVYDLCDLGAPPMVVASALRQQRRERTFLPAIAEVLEAVRSRWDSDKGLVRLLERIPTQLEARRQQRDYLRKLEAMT